MNAKAIVGRYIPKNHHQPTPTQDRAAPDRDDTIAQYSVIQILAAWAATAVPMGALAWIVTPWLRDRLAGRDPFIDAILICFLAGLLMQVALLLILVAREQGSLRWANIRDALWLQAPTNPRSRRRGGKIWWWALPFVLLSGLINAGWIDPAGPLPRDLPKTLELDRGRLEHYFHGNWAAFALLVGVALLAPVVEELFFRGLLLPRMRAAFGRGDVVANGVLFGVYHLHQPWSVPASILDGILTQAYPTRRFRSIWIGIITHTVPSFVIIGAALPLVL